MIKSLKFLTLNAKRVCIADFFWNLGRTLPHAILTVFLISQGYSLTDIAIFQSIFMIVSLLTEFPSGVWADIYSRKFIYLLSLMTLFISYLLIGFFSNNFLILCISYILYGLSVSLKSGTLDAEVILELSDPQKIKKYTVLNSYIMSISSIIGGLFGSFLYGYIHRKIYIIALVLFFFSFISGALCSFNVIKKEKDIENKTLYIEVKKGLIIIKKSDILKLVLYLFAVTMLFIQPFFQYWQVLYQDNNIPEKYFGIVYVLFQVCNIIGTTIYKRVEFKHSTFIIVLILIPMTYCFLSILKWGNLIALPLVAILFFIYNMHLNVIQKQNAPKEFISSFFSVTGTIQNIFSIISLFAMATCFNLFGIKIAYFVIFTIFSIIAVMIQNKLDILIKKEQIFKNNMLN